MHVLKNRDHGARLFVSRPRHRWEQMPINTRPECTEYDPGMRRRGMMDGSGPERGTRQQSISRTLRRSGQVGLGGASWLCFAPVAANWHLLRSNVFVHSTQINQYGSGILSSSARHLLLLKSGQSLARSHLTLTSFFPVRFR